MLTSCHVAAKETAPSAEVTAKPPVGTASTSSPTPVETPPSAVPSTHPSSSSSVEVAAKPSSTGRLSPIYPGARVLHQWIAGHAHSILWVSTDPPHQVKAYFRRYAKETGYYKVKDSKTELSLDGGGAFGFISIYPAPTSPPDVRLTPVEKTMISSSRP